MTKRRTPTGLLARCRMSGVEDVRNLAADLIDAEDENRRLRANLSALTVAAIVAYGHIDQRRGGAMRAADTLDTLIDADNITREAASTAAREAGLDEKPRGPLTGSMPGPDVEMDGGWFSGAAALRETSVTVSDLDLSGPVVDWVRADEPPIFLACLMCAPQPGGLCVCPPDEADASGVSGFIEAAQRVEAALTDDSNEVPNAVSDAPPTPDAGKRGGSGRPVVTLLMCSLCFGRGWREGPAVGRTRTCRRCDGSWVAR